MPDLRDSITTHLQAMVSMPLREASLSLLKSLGYESDKTIASEDSSPQAFLDLIEANNPDCGFSEEKALVSDWLSADLLFQLTDEEISKENTLFEDREVKPSLLKSYVFFALELNGESAVNGAYARGKLTAIARQINRAFPMPVMALIKHQNASGAAVLSIAVINRRQNKRDTHKDVLSKVTIIRDVSLEDPHRGHKDILNSFAFDNLKHPQKLPITDFDTLHAAWEEIFNIELLNKRFYKELANWYFWAMPQVEFPADLEPDDEKRRATGLIRLLTRLIFCWFLKEKGLIPEKLFHQTDLEQILADFDPESDDCSSYYHAILQNLFFATLNQRMGKDKKTGNPYRVFAKDEGFLKNRATYDVNNLYRYESLFKGDPDAALGHFADIPFLNGGLFECLDRSEDESNKKRYIDGFSRNLKKRPTVPNKLFFAGEVEDVDLSGVYHDKKRKKESVSGLIRILNRYKFTIVENTPIDQEIALDPELLGKVFENLLASYNEETRTTARKQTGSFYTPRLIVDYMVDESLKAHLSKALTESAEMKEKDAKAGLDLLFIYTERDHLFSEPEVETLLDAIHSCKILDPACGSGAFPMGMLHKLVYILGKLDPDNARWQARQIEAAERIPDPSARDAAVAAIEKDFAENEDDYGRKLYLIESCLYGVDIQPIAIQISKLRFFISLVCDQKTNRDKAKNHGIRPLPNLETRFVAADTLIGLKKDVQTELFDSPKIEKIEKQLQRVRHDHFSAQTRRKKLDLQRKDKQLRGELEEELNQSTFADQETSHKLASWDPYDPHVSADFFEPLWMFDRSLAEGFDVIIANPPYIVLSKDVADSARRATILSIYEVAEYKCDFYALFIERGMGLLKNGGILTYIVPNPWLTQKYFSKLRKFLLGTTKIGQIMTIEPAVFESAVVNNAILITENRASPSSHKVSVYQLEEIETISQCIPLKAMQSEWQTPPSYIFETRLLTSEGQLAKGIIESQERLDSYCRASIGCQAYNRTKHSDETVRSRAFHSDHKETPEHFLEIGGRQVSRFKVDIDQGKWIRYGEWLHDYRSPEWLSDCRILVREITAKPPRRICAAYTNKELAFYKTVLCVIPDKRNEQMARYICAILNSSVISFVYPYAANKFVTKTFPRISVADLKSLPIPEPSPRELDTIQKIAAAIEFSIGSNNVIATFLEDLIDACVMECYFREHMAERDLLFHDELAPHLASYDLKSNESQQRDFLTHLHQNLNAPESKIRNRLLRLTADSPDLLAIIKEEGKV